MGYDATYEAMHVPDGEFASALETLSKRDILGVNVTLPHKSAALKAANEASDAAEKIGAANTLTYLGDRAWRADNTDAPGFISAIGESNPDTDEVMILGAGGSAAAIVYALAKSNFRVTILNRTVGKAHRLARNLGTDSTRYGSFDQYKEQAKDASLIINTTSMGHDGQVLELPDGKDRLFFDISYGKVAAPQLAHARDRGWQTRDGLTMLVAQAAISFEIWFGEAPDRAAALERCQWAMKAVS
jgi:shikimate dehydrogenase